MAVDALAPRGHDGVHQRAVDHRRVAGDHVLVEHLVEVHARLVEERAALRVHLGIAEDVLGAVELRHGLVARGQHLKGAGELIGVPDVVLVAERHVIHVHWNRAQNVEERPHDAQVLAGQEVNPPVGGVSPQDLARGVARTVVAHVHRELGSRGHVLRQHAVQLLGHVLGAVVGGHDDGYARHLCAQGLPQ